MLHVSNERIPNQVYQQLRVKTGLSKKSDEAAEIGLNHSLHFVQVKNESHECVGMGRIVGDGGCFCQVVDICVLPEWQGQGIGKMIMQNIMDFIENTLPENCYISLLADGNASDLYKQFGFKDTMPASRGMFFKR